MSESSNVIVKNTSMLLVSQVVTWIFSFLVTIIQPRYIGPSGAGQLAIAYAIWTILGSLITLGTDTLLVRDVARHPETSGRLMGTVMILRGLIYLVSCIGLAAYLYFMNYPLQTLIIILIIGAAQVFAQIVSVGTSVLRGIERMKYIALTDIISKAINVTLIFLVVVFDLGLYAIAAVAVIVAICSVLIQRKWLKQFVTIQLNFDRAHAVNVFRASLPFVVSGLVLTSYFQIDTLVMAALVDTHEMGWYSVALTLSGTFLFLPVIISSVIFPAFARTYGDTSNTSNRLLSKSIDLMFLLGIPIGFGLTSISALIIPLFYGSAFAPAATILAMMGFVLVFTYIATVVGQFLVATDKINIWTIIMIVAVVITVPLDIWLIPLCERMFGNGAIGGAVTFLITEFGMAAVGVLLLPHNTLQWSNVRIAFSTLIAGLCMMGVCWLVRDQFILIPILVGGITYITLILLLRVVPREDMILFIDAGQRIIDRLRNRQAETTSPSEA